MSRILIGAIFLLFSIQIFADVDSVFVDTTVYRQKTVMFKKQIRINNNLNSYRLDCLQFQPTAARPAEFQIQLREPDVNFSFSRPLGPFINLRINGINLKNLEFKADDFKIWKKDKKAGVNILLNYNGVSVVLSFFMKDDSPVLWGKLSPARNSVEKITTVSLFIYAVPSVSISGKTAGVYQRVAFALSEKLTQKNKIQKIPKTNHYLILADDKFQPTPDNNAIGPCFIAFNAQSTEQILLNMQNSFKTTLEFNLKPHFKTFSFGIWESEKKYTNDDFFKMFQKSKNSFIFQEHTIK